MKKILIVLSIFLLTGCTINYNLDISKDSIEENITGNISKYEFDDITDEYADHNIYYLLHDKQLSLSDGSDYYDQNIIDKGDNIDFSYKYTYNNNFGMASIINRCFENKVYEETNDLYIIHLYGDFYCQYNDNIEVNVNTNLAVLENNADEVDGNNYKWILKEDNNDVDITLTISKSIEQFTPAKENSILTPYRIVTFIILVVLIGVSFVIYKKRNSEN